MRTEVYHAPVDLVFWTVATNIGSLMDLELDYESLHRLANTAVRKNIFGLRPAIMAKF